MNFQSYFSQPFEGKFKQLEAEKKQLQVQKKQLCAAIEELNCCYQEKIQLLEATISHQQERYQELLQWKQQHVGTAIFETEKYEYEIKKMIEILDNAHSQFQTQQTVMEKQLLESQQHSQVLSQQNLKLREQNQLLQKDNRLLQEETQRLQAMLTQMREESETVVQHNQDRIEEMVRTYTEEIGKLKEELKALREQSVCSQDCLRDITATHNRQNIAPNMATLDPSISKLLHIVTNE